jgi:hypothetical protein
MRPRQAHVGAAYPLREKRVPPTALVGPRSGVLWIVCAQRDASGRVAVTYVRPELTYKGNKVTSTRPTGIANPQTIERTPLRGYPLFLLLNFGARNVQTPNPLREKGVWSSGVST